MVIMIILSIFESVAVAIGAIIAIVFIVVSIILWFNYLRDNL